MHSEAPAEFGLLAIGGKEGFAAKQKEKREERSKAHIHDKIILTQLSFRLFLCWVQLAVCPL
jgi:hypothetical protein